MEILLSDQIKKVLNSLKKGEESLTSFRKGNLLYVNGMAIILSQSKHRFEVLVDDEFNDFNVTIYSEEDLKVSCSCKTSSWCHHRIAALLQLSENLGRYNPDGKPEGKAYTRKGMIKRVLEERTAKAHSSKYKIHLSDNAFGEHILINERSKQYKLTFRDYDSQNGYCSCTDYRTNKLGTCKHLIYAFSKAKGISAKKLKKEIYPFIEIYLDPLNKYQISWYFPHSLPGNLKPLFQEYFGNGNTLLEDKTEDFLGFLNQANDVKQILIRPEVLDVTEAMYDQRTIDSVRANSKIDFSVLKAELFPYQKEGIKFATYLKGAMIADEMGLGKTLQAIGTAIFKKQLFHFKKTLIICPASLKSQWKSEIEKFSNEKAIIVEGFPDERVELYNSKDAFFYIINYETTLRDVLAINNADFDFLILDEAQRIKNFETITANAVKSLKKKHGLVITGTPIENKLVDVYSIVDFVSPGFLSPLWEFSYQHCYFDIDQKNKITGYYNLQKLKDRLKPILLRREKQDVLEQLNNITHIDVPIEFHDTQQEYHASAALAIARILSKKFKTPYDMQMLTKHLQVMRMACDSTYLVDKQTNHSPKLIELEEILLEKLNIHKNKRKIIIFSEWKRMLHIIGKMLSRNNIGFTELTGDVPVGKRKKIISEFETNPDCRVFLSTEAGGSGLNLQVADTVINFELPWNPAKKNQRIGRIDRLGQKNTNLTVINLIMRKSIEMKIAAGLTIKQNLFDSVLSPQNKEDIVDFSEKGRAQFLQQLEDLMAEFSLPQQSENIPEIITELELEDLFTPEAQAQEQSVRIQRLQEMETVMKSGMDFLAGMFKMSTGKELLSTDNKIEIDHQTGEIVMRFKLPV